MTDHTRAQRQDPQADRLPTRWEAAGRRGYGQRFADLIAEGADIDGEARLVDVLAPRGGTVLDAGSGMGRVAAGVQARGHQVTAVEKDPELVAQSRATFPDVPVVQADLADLTPELLRVHGQPDSFDVVVAVGNVVIFLAPDSEVTVLGRLAALLRPAGRLLVGFHTGYGDGTGDTGVARRYAPEEFEKDLAAAGLVIQQRFGTYELHPPADDYCVYVLTPA